MISPNIKVPGTGGITHALSYSTGREPDVVLGKPYKYMMDTILQHYNLDPSKSIMIGDRLDTDILFGKNVFLF